MRKTCPIDHTCEETQTVNSASAVINPVNVENKADHRIFDVSEIEKILRGRMVLHTAAALPTMGMCAMTTHEFARLD